MQCKTLDEFKKFLREAIDNQDMEAFKSLLMSVDYCPFPSFYLDDYKTENYCPDCPLSGTNEPEEFTGDWRAKCLLGTMKGIYVDYRYHKKPDKKTALARLILEATKLLAYLENRG